MTERFDLSGTTREVNGLFRVELRTVDSECGAPRVTEYNAYETFLEDDHSATV